MPILTSGFAGLALATTAAVHTALVSGVLVSRPGALMRCLSWPGVVGLGKLEDLHEWMYLAKGLTEDGNSAFYFSVGRTF